MFITALANVVTTLTDIKAFGSIDNNGLYLLADNPDSDFDDQTFGLPVIAGEINEELLDVTVKVKMACTSKLWYVSN